MKGIHVNADLCTADELCVRDCPRELLYMNEETGLPAPVDDFDDLCIHCGHCMAVCPTAALSVRGMMPDLSVDLNESLKLTPHHIRQILRGRRSVRRFQPEPVVKGLIEELIDVARYAPTGSNRQEVWYRIYSKRADIDRLYQLVVDWIESNLENETDPVRRKVAEVKIEDRKNDRDTILWRAPHVVLALGPLDNPFITVDAATALAYWELAAPVFGLGTCWAGYLVGAARTYQPIRDELAVPEGHGVLGGLMLGRPAVDYQRLPERRVPEVDWR